MEGGPGMLPGSPYDSALDGTEAAWYPPGRFQDLLAADDHPKTPEGLQVLPKHLGGSALGSNVNPLVTMADLVGTARHGVA